MVGWDASKSDTLQELIGSESARSGTTHDHAGTSAREIFADRAKTTACHAETDLSKHLFDVMRQTVQSLAVTNSC